MSTPHRAMPEQWADVAIWAAEGLASYACILELRSRLEALEASATCPHVVTGDEGTSYCGLAEQTARIGQLDVPANTSARPAPAGSLVERVGHAIASADEESLADSWAPEARAAIRAVAEWLRERGWELAARALEQEAEQ